ncbi:OTU protein [Mycoemilia scoparia]|uniref:OTU protein n=1 Tax=Mycoemilia scoparia TaxID=417184 RepID=A0A9W8DVC5_9FUNG|nr:OTU protein [Mycoemilia scoparia]
MSTIAETNFEDLEARHRKELKELTNKIMGLKKSVPKGDKKRKKEVTAEVAKLEAEIKERHAQEVDALKQKLESGSDEKAANKDVDIITEKIESVNMKNHSEPEEPSKQQAPRGKKKNKAKMRLQRRQEEMERLQAEAEKEAEGMVDMQKIENEAIERILEINNLSIYDIRPDGHCLYAAFADQLNKYHGKKLTYADLRTQTAKYMRNNTDDFMPFMVHDDGSMFSNDDFEKYCNDLETTAVWGGQQEILALSHIFNVPVEIYQMGQPKLKISEHYNATPILLSYHRHAYGLGEHYNSLHKKQ